MIILSLSICSLFELELLHTVLFTVLFSTLGYSAIIYLKLKFSLWEDEREYIELSLSKVKTILHGIGSFFMPRRSTLWRLFCRCILAFISD